MAILNITPDSFSDGGELDSVQQAVDYAGRCLKNGADILDVGGESTRPGAEEITIEEELNRVIPIIRALNKEFSKVTISIDTRKVRVAAEAIEAGATLVNDVSGGCFDPKMDDLIAMWGVDYCLMHAQGTPQTMQENPTYPNGVVQDIHTFFTNRIQTLLNKGAKREQLIIDPGFGFGKTLEDNNTLLDNLNVFTSFALPLLVGLSRKSFLTQGKDISPKDRDTLSITAMKTALSKGAHIFRVHNVKALQSAFSTVLT